MFRRSGELCGDTERGPVIYLAPTQCTSRSSEEFPAGLALLFHVHLDVHGEDPDLCVEREGVFANREGIKPQSRGLPGVPNTTVYKETDHARDRRAVRVPPPVPCARHQILRGVRLLRRRRPAKSFPDRDDIHEKFKDFERLPGVSGGSDAHVSGIPGGARELPCTAWGKPDLQREGLEGPC